MKIPITLGIIGHRDAVIVPAHRMLIIKTLNLLNERFPHSPLVLFSQLAQGADLEVARIFLEHKKRTGLAYRLIVPLPFEKEEYIRDFDPEHLECFHRVYDAAEEKFVVPQQKDDDRNMKFRRGGQFVADSSMVLIGFSDQKKTGGVGGTDDLLYYKVNGTFREHVDDRLFNLHGTALVLPCDRGDSREVTEDELTEELLDDFFAIPDVVETLTKTDEINQFSTRNRKKEDWTESWEICTQGEDPSNARNLKDWHNVFASHSTIHKRIYNRFVNGFFYLGAFLVGGSQVVSVLAAIFSTHEDARAVEDLITEYGGVLLLLIVMVLFMVAIFIKRYTKWKDHTIFIDDRVVAEAIRTQFFWKQSGIQQPVARHILRIHKQEHNWLPNILNAIYGLTLGNPSQVCHWTTIQRNWIEDQYAYFIKSMERYENKREKYRLFYFGVGFLGFIGLLLLFACILYEDSFVKGTGAWNSFEVVKAMGICLVNVAVGWVLIAMALYEKKGYDQMRTQYAMMSRIFGKTRNKMNEIGEVRPEEHMEERLHNLLYLTGKEALIENGNWYLIFKERAPDIVVIPGTA